MEWLNIIMRWLHLASVITLVGTVVFLRLIIKPAIGNFSEETRLSVLSSFQYRLKILLHSAITGILISGLYNAHVIWKTTESTYHNMLLVKILLVLVVLILAIFSVSGSSTENQYFSKKTQGLTLSLVLAVIIIALSAFLRSLH